jgi:asparagine synthase (glutamine-hydrolysing)
MCGICGVVRRRDLNTNLGLLTENMMDSMIARGPDSSGHVVEDSWSFGFRRLKVIDTSVLGDQPMWDSDRKSVIVFNGELYNFKEVRQELIAEGFQFRSTSDTEVALNAWKLWGPQTVNRLTGMYAFALYEVESNVVTLVRDRLGIKPLYFAENSNFFVFASSAEAIRSTGIFSDQISMTALSSYLSWQAVTSGKSIYSEVQALPPAHMAKVDSSGTRVHKYWSELDFIKPDSRKSDEDWKMGFSELFERSMKQHLTSDVELGSFLSGGVDSTIIADTAQKFSASPIKTISVGFDVEKYSESQIAQNTAKRLGTEHIELQFGVDDFKDSIDSFLTAMDQPTGDGLNTFIVARHARNNGLTVALSGLGADEIFGGYAGFQRIANRFPVFHRHLSSTRAIEHCSKSLLELVSMKTDLRFSLVGKALRFLAFSTTVPKQFRLMAEFFKPSDKMSHLLNYPEEESLERYEDIEVTDQNIMSIISCLYIKYFMQSTLLPDSDVMGMSSSLEIRVPFLDHRVVEYALQMPVSAKIPNGVSKGFLRNVYRDALSPEILNQQKRGFVFPVAIWMRDHHKGMLLDMLNADLNQWEVFDKKAVFGLAKYYFRTGSDQAFKMLWLYYSLFGWMQKKNLSF